MAYRYAADTDTLYRVDADLWTSPAGYITYGIWASQTSYTHLHWLLHGNFWGVGNGGGLYNENFGVGDNRLSANRGFTTTDVEWASGFNKLDVTGTWKLYIVVNDGTTGGSGNATYIGDQSTAMAVDSGAGFNGSPSGSARTGGFRVMIGNNWQGTNGIRGDLARAFAVPWGMTLSEAELFRQGDWSQLTKYGSYIFFYPLDTVNNNVDPVTGIVLNITGATFVSDPLGGSFSSPTIPGNRSNSSYATTYGMSDRRSRRVA